MQFRLIAKVDGNIHIPQPISVRRERLVFEFRTDKSGRIVEVAVSMQVPTEKIEKFRSTIGPGEGGSAATFKIGGDSEIYQQLVAELQLLESNLAFATVGALERIEWNSPKQEFIAENLGEQKLISVRGYEIREKYPPNSASLKPDQLAGLVTKAPQYRALEIPKAFWREGINHFTNFQYIQAFYSYYFIIEDFYAGGKSGKKAVLQEFAKSSEFAEIAEISLQSMLKEERHGENLRKLFEEENCEISGRGLQELLYNVRGNLHHYSSKGIKLRGTPFTQKQFESIALLTGHIATLAIGYREAAISQSEELNVS
jgi:hypothetical protein